jgi:hypothetical protein
MVKPRGDHDGNSMSAPLVCSRLSFPRGKSAPGRQIIFGQAHSHGFAWANGWPFPKWTPVSRLRR